jgi:hypothetical protein
MNREKRGQLAERARVLRVKLGYNPNSSSVGSEIPKFLAFALAAGVTATLWLHLRGRVGRLIREWRSRDAGDHGSEVE